VQSTTTPCPPDSKHGWLLRNTPPVAIKTKITSTSMSRFTRARATTPRTDRTIPFLT